MKKIVAALLAAMLLAGCGLKELPAEPVQGNIDTPIPQQTTGETKPEEADISATEEEMFTQRDSKTDYDEAGAVQIRLEDGAIAASSDSVVINGSAVILREEATYLISGSLSDGQLVVDAPDTAKLQLVFNGVDITSQTSAALYILEADKVFVTLAEGTENALANGGSFTAIDDNNIDGAVFSKQDLTFNGSGTLQVSAPAGHGIVCKDDLVITGGSYTVLSSSHGLDANDSVRIKEAVLSIDAGKDAIHCENSDDTAKGFVYIAGGTVRAEAEGDGISAGAYLQMTGGTVELLVGGGSENGTKASSDYYGGFMDRGPGGMRPGENATVETEDTVSMKGLKAVSGLQISGGSITVNSADDAIHCDTSLTISGGTFTLASGDDAIHAEQNLTVTDGRIDVSESYEGLEALHIDVQGGKIRLVASDDGLNAAGGTDQSGITGGRDGMFGGGRPGRGGFGGMSSGSGGSIQISGGEIYVKASGDGLDANGTLQISGGYTVVTGPTQGDTATLDYDTGATITGGTFIGSGAAGMAQTFSSSDQGVIALSTGNQPAGTKILLTDGQGNTLIAYEPELGFAVAILSCPQLVKGQSYTVTIGDRSGEFQAS